jgi:two-component system, cell cycle sensor histidine kinase and response regulator CckA
MITDQQQRLELVGQMASGIAHDLNNQMMLILNHLDFALRQIPAHQPVRGDLTDVKKAAERCTEMIGSLLAFGRPTVARLQRTDLTVMLAESARLLRRVMPARIDLQFSIDRELLPVWGDETQLQQVILNLAVNARDAMPSGGVLQIEARNYGGSLAITVRDNGCGMAPEVLSRIQEPYFTTRQDSGGTGLGLANVARILADHQAVMSVESTLGEGTRFHILFPCHALPCQTMV